MDQVKFVEDRQSVKDVKGYGLLLKAIFHKFYFFPFLNTFVLFVAVTQVIIS